MCGSCHRGRGGQRARAGLQRPAATAAAAAAAPPRAWRPSWRRGGRKRQVTAATAQFGARGRPTRCATFKWARDGRTPRWGAAQTALQGCRSVLKRATRRRDARQGRLTSFARLVDFCTPAAPQLACDDCQNPDGSLPAVRESPRPARQPPATSQRGREESSGPGQVCGPECLRSLAVRAPCT